MADEEESVKVLRQRYAKGEISKKQYLEMKADLKGSEETTKNKSGTKMNKNNHLVRNVGIVVFILLVLFLVLSNNKSNTLGTATNPYNANLGHYQGTGYYTNVSGKSGTVYIGSQAQFSSYVSTTLSTQTTTSTSISSTQTTSATTTVSNCPTVVNVGTYGSSSTGSNCSDFSVNIGTYGSYSNYGNACPSEVNIGTYGKYYNNVTGCSPIVNIGTGASYYNINNEPTTSIYATASTTIAPTTTLPYYNLECIVNSGFSCSNPELINSKLSVNIGQDTGTYWSSFGIGYAISHINRT